MQTTPDKNLIERSIPHRAPFLLLDEVEEISENSISASVTVREDDELFSRVYTGHYPGNPITPGVLLCEMVFQAGAVLLAQRLEDPESGVPVLVRIRDARFKQMVRPGDTVSITCEFEEQVSNAFYMKGAATVNGKPAVRVSFTCALVDKENG